MTAAAMAPARELFPLPSLMVFTSLGEGLLGSPFPEVPEPEPEPEPEVECNDPSLEEPGDPPLVPELSGSVSEPDPFEESSPPPSVSLVVLPEEVLLEVPPLFPPALMLDPDGLDAVPVGDLVVEIPVTLLAATSPSPRLPLPVPELLGDAVGPPPTFAGLGVLRAGDGVVFVPGFATAVVVV